MSVCPCGSKLEEAACCGPLIAGDARAATAEALMRSRYTAYVRGAIDYLVATHDAKSRGDIDVPGITAWSRETEWKGLEIVDKKRGAATDTTGVVEFIARGVTNGKAFAQRERSQFAKLDGGSPPSPSIDGAWFYVDGIAAAEPESREPAKKPETPGRNEPCPCGSGKKYKKCHGA